MKRNKTPIKAVIFDMGGVLLKTVDSHARESMAEEFGTMRAELEDFVFNSQTSLASEVGKISDVVHWETILAHFGLKNKNILDVYDQYFSGDEIDERLLRFIDKLKMIGLKTGLLSNAWVNARERLSKRFEFLGVFDESIFSYEVRSRKPDPEIYFEMLWRLSALPSESLFIDDVEENVIGARHIGLNAFQFRSSDETIRRITE